ncbi:uncharacterized protein LOC131859082 [Cryptomeria japonica]|uniref:uncharacterized protein LOC131859082 n=1 Tax=Cryptomeria japonica TaxID=3369 RepID=UPI0027D9D841|nr:uncharacterized protein LOC131859082 [Cryptomeria japonica]
MAKILGRNVKSLVKKGFWKGAFIHNSIDPISHSQFADDTILFGEATEKEAMVIKKLLNDYEIGSGLSFKAAKELDNLFKKFLWEGAQEKKKFPLINWDTTCLIKLEGGAGLRKMDFHNQALGAKLAWKMYSQPHKTWCKIMVAKYLDSTEAERIFTVANSIKGSPIWKHIWESGSILIEHLTWKIGNGGKAKFWRDSWNGDISLAEEIDKEWIYEVETKVGYYVADYILEGQKESDWIKWKSVGEWKMEKNMQLKDILNRKKKNYIS